MYSHPPPPKLRMKSLIYIPYFLIDIDQFMKVKMVCRSQFKELMED